MECHKNCAACCIVISISTPLPNMPEGKPAGIRCVNLDENNLCTIHDKPNYPDVCRNFKMTSDTCGNNADYAFKHLHEIELLTTPNKIK
ncbi:MAG TPA: YkgJ family cysteine cluster protein [Ignavibacteria bacterium]